MARSIPLQRDDDGTRHPGVRLGGVCSSSQVNGCHREGSGNHGFHLPGYSQVVWRWEAGVMNIESSAQQLPRRQILSALRAFRRGDFSIRIADRYEGIDAEIAATFNEIVEINDQLTREFERLSRVVGKDGRIGERGHIHKATGSWNSSIRSVND
ncbi:hypothetical protein AB4144_31745, partial [Rhizobiaceae sp. 2RAB30]